MLSAFDMGSGCGDSNRNLKFVGPGKCSYHARSWLSVNIDAAITIRTALRTGKCNKTGILLGAAEEVHSLRICRISNCEPFVSRVTFACGFDGNNYSDGVFMKLPVSSFFFIDIVDGLNRPAALSRRRLGMQSGGSAHFHSPAILSRRTAKSSLRFIQSICDEYPTRALAPRRLRSERRKVRALFPPFRRISSFHKLG